MSLASPAANVQHGYATCRDFAQQDQVLRHVGIFARQPCRAIALHNDIKELTRVPLTDFWNRWRRRQPQPGRRDCAPTLREAEKRRRGAARHAAKELATIVTMPPRAAKPQDSNTG